MIDRGEQRLFVDALLRELSDRPPDDFLKSPLLFGIRILCDDGEVGLQNPAGVAPEDILSDSGVQKSLL